MSTAVFSKFYAPAILALVLLIGTANIVFYQQFVRRPWQRGVHAIVRKLLPPTEEG